MSSENKRTGKCLCGAVRITVDASRTDLGACHCALCRNWSGGPLLEIECGTEVVFKGSSNIAAYESSARALRGFCRICGTHLYIKTIPGNEYGIPPGLFEEQKGIQFGRQVFIDHKPSYYSFADATENITSTYIYKHHPETSENT